MRRWFCLAVVSLLVGCAQPADELPRIDTGPIAAAYPLVDGSTSTLPIQVMAACRIFDVRCEWEEIPYISQERHISPVRNTAGELDPAAEPVTRIWHSGTHESYTRLIDGEVDLILVARAPSESEVQYANEQGVALDVRPIALDAFVFVVHEANPAANLSLETIRNIYTGDINQWEQAAPGTDFTGSIHAYRRNSDSGSQELMEDLVMQGEPMIDTPGFEVSTMIALLHQVGDQEDHHAIGYSVYFYVTSILPHNYVKLIGVDGVEPNADTIADRLYPLTTEVYVVVRDVLPADSTALLLRDWLLTADGQTVIEATGYIPLR